MTQQHWPYNLPIWRRSHRATSPDGSRVAQIAAAREVSMGNPTSGVLCVSGELHIERCNPSFIWSDDSRFLAVPCFVDWLGVVRRQRLLVIDFEKRAVYASRATAWYYQPEAFSGGVLRATVNPTGRKRTIEFRVPDELRARCTHAWWVPWPDDGSVVAPVAPAS
jgi:hypothetical protein